MTRLSFGDYVVAVNNRRALITLLPRDCVAIGVHLFCEQNRIRVIVLNKTTFRMQEKQPVLVLF